MFKRWSIYIFISGETPPLTWISIIEWGHYAWWSSMELKKILKGNEFRQLVRSQRIHHVKTKWWNWNMVESLLTTFRLTRHAESLLLVKIVEDWRRRWNLNFVRRLSWRCRTVGLANPHYQFLNKSPVKVHKNRKGWNEQSLVLLGHVSYPSFPI